jgi:DNA helicase-2/ATP-dependent DNA helicase PcrA
VRVHRDLPGEECRIGGDPVTSSSTTSSSTGIEIRTPEDLQRVMQTDYAPSAQQWEAISAPLAPAVVIAGAGSGKTTLMAARVVYLVVTGQVRPDEILGLTFTTKAAAELRGRIREALQKAGALEPVVGADGAVEDVLEPTVATYNAYASGLLTDHGLRIGHEPDTRVITDASRFQLGARVVERYSGLVRALSDHPPTVIQNLLALDGAMSEHLVTVEDVVRVDADACTGFTASLAIAQAELDAGKRVKGQVDAIKAALNVIERRGELLGLVASYRRLKRDLGLMDFSDQIELGARLATSQPEVGEVERARFKVVLLDEYQDTSVAQATMLSRLFGDGHPVTAVGDPNQAIYGWRGASVSNILNFADAFPSADGVASFPLTVNRRSDRRILEVANRLAGPLLEKYPQVAPLEPAPGAADGVVEARIFETNADELSWLATEVAAAHTGAKHGLWSDIGVLTRDNAHGADVFDVLTTAGIPVEIVGLSGLLRLPEVAEVVATLHLLHDVTANASLLTLLNGPRWAIGPRDLKLLGKRSAEIAGGRRAAAGDVAEHLVQITDGVDPAELPSLSDALDDLGEPSEWPYSAEARERFGLLAGELRTLRTSVGEPLLDVVRRIIDTTGVDVELASSVSPAASARRDNLDLFVKAVADFQAVDGDVTLAALLAYLTAEDDQGNGLDVATPTEADSVKLLTVHRSKGLEWATTFVVGVCETRFPTNRSRTLWTSSPPVLPAPLRGDAADLPQLAAYDKASLDAYREATKRHDAEEELRLGYVAFTRAAHRLVVSSYLWNKNKSPLGPSAYQQVVRDCLEMWGEPPADWLVKPEKGAANPLAEQETSRPWPVDGVGREALLRRDAAERVVAVDLSLPDPELDMVEASVVAEWDAELERLVAEARQERASDIEVSLPSSLSATSVARLRDDPDAFARELARPMPRPPSSAARFGTRFHAYVEARFGQQQLIGLDELPGAGDAEIDEVELRELVAAFEEGEFADRVPHAVEPPFALVLDGQVVRGRIDAVYVEPDGSFLVIDWKTNRTENADPLQLAIYRLAWAELTGVPVEQVRAAFHYVRSGRTVEPADLPGREELEEVLRL